MNLVDEAARLELLHTTLGGFCFPGTVYICFVLFPAKQKEDRLPGQGGFVVSIEGDGGGLLQGYHFVMLMTFDFRVAGLAGVFNYPNHVCEHIHSVAQDLILGVEGFRFVFTRKAQFSIDEFSAYGRFSNTCKVISTYLSRVRRGVVMVMDECRLGIEGGE